MTSVPTPHSRGTPFVLTEAPRHSGPATEAPAAPRGSAVRFAVLCPAGLVQERLAEALRGEAGLQPWRAGAESRPDVVLCAAASGAGLRGLLESPLLSPWPRAVLFDLAGRLGALGAGLHRFHGYCPPEVSADRLRRCLLRVATGQRDAPRPHHDTLIRILDAPPLDARDRTILGLLALGAPTVRIARAADLTERGLRYRLARLENLFEAEDRSHLAAIAVALDLGWPWAADPPVGWLPGSR